MKFLFSFFFYITVTTTTITTIGPTTTITTTTTAPYGREWFSEDLMLRSFHHRPSLQLSDLPSNLELFRYTLPPPDPEQPGSPRQVRWLRDLHNIKVLFLKLPTKFRVKLS